MLLALDYMQERYGKAPPLFERSLSIREEALGSDHADVAASLNNLAALWEAQVGDRNSTCGVCVWLSRTVFCGVVVEIRVLSELPKTLSNRPWLDPLHARLWCRDA